MPVVGDSDAASTSHAVASLNCITHRIHQEGSYGLLATERRCQQRTITDSNLIKLLAPASASGLGKPHLIKVRRRVTQHDPSSGRADILCIFGDAVYLIHH